MGEMSLDNLSSQYFDVLKELGNIGAGNATDGQVLVLHDMLGLNQGFKPKFLRHFAHLAEEVKQAVGEYITAVKESSFPSAEESY